MWDGLSGRANPLHALFSRLHNVDVNDNSHHWRPWVNGLPVGMQPVYWITGQWENGVYYYYAAIFGRGVWKREARGGDLRLLQNGVDARGVIPLSSPTTTTRLTVIVTRAA